MAEPSAPTRVAIIGAGFGRYALAPAFRRDPRCRVVAVCAGSDGSAARAAAQLGLARHYGSLEALYDAGEFDAVAVATPPAVQPRAVEMALDREIPVFAEKLLALSVEQARALADGARAAGVANVVDYIFPETDAWRAARERLAGGAVGALRHIAASWLMESHDHRHGLSTWKTAPGAGGGALQHFGPHVLRYLEWLAGPIASVHADVTRAADIAGPGDTLVAAGLRFASGATGTVTLSNAAPGGSGHRVEIVGSAGVVLLVNDTADAVHGARLFVRGRERPAEEVALPELPPPSRETDARVLPVSRLASRFLDWVREGRSTAPSFADGVRVQVLLEAVQHSAATGTRVDVCAT